MILEKESEIKALKAFYNEPFDYFSVAEISRKAKISRNWIYRIIGKFEKYGILAKSGKKYKMDFSSLFCKRAKLLFDADYLDSLSGAIKEDVFGISNRMLFEAKPKSIILVGSVAAQKMKKGSDIDFLVIGEDRERIPAFGNANIVMLSEKELEERYMKGDDFVISALAFGKIIYDREFFIKFLGRPLPAFSQELIQEKIKYCEMLEERIYSLLKTDEPKAKGELLYLAIQAARIILLKNNVIPKTKHDIASQTEIYNKELADIIARLMGAKKMTAEEMLQFSRRCMSFVK